MKSIAAIANSPPPVWESDRDSLRSVWSKLAPALWAVLWSLFLVGAAPAVAPPACNEIQDICTAEQFLDFYDEINGLFFLGLPESEATREGNFLIQYFQKGRLELNLVSGHVRKGDVGLDLVRHRIPFTSGEIPDDSPAHLYFAETGQSISFAFKDFYLFNDGFRQFGPPVSPDYDDGLLWAPQVQYFAKARLEYHPENIGTPDLIQIGNVGFELVQAARRGTAVPVARPLRYGMQVHTWHALQHREIVKFVAEARFGWVKHLVLWSEVEPAEGEYDWVELDAFVEAAEFNQLQALVTIVDAPSWSRSGTGPGRPDDLQTFRRFMEVVADRYRGRIAAYEIWNEPNLARFWGRAIVPHEYAQLLKAAYEGVKEFDPNALVLFAGLAQNGASDPSLGVDDIDFLRAVYRYDGGAVKKWFDVMGNHSYGYRSPPHAEYDSWFGDDFGPFLSHPSFFFRRFTQIRAVMEEFEDGAKPMWMTEFGWTTDNRHRDFVFGQFITAEQQARFIVDAFELVETEYPYVHAMFIFNLNFRTLDLPNTSEHGFGILDAGFTARPAYDAVQAMDKSKVSPARLE